MRKLYASAVLACISLLLLFPAGAQSAKTISGTITTNTVLDTVGGRIYQVTGSVTVNSGVTLTVQPGVVIKFNASTSLNISGTLMAVGGSTLDSLIYFTSIKDDNAPAPAGDDTNGDGNATVPASGNWYYVRFMDSAADSSKLKHCVVRYGGQSNSGVILCENASPKIENCDLSSAYYGVQCNAVSNPTIKSTSFNAMTSVPIAISIQADPIFDNVVFESTSDNGYDALGIIGGTLTGNNTLGIRGATLGTTPIDNLVYVLLSNVTIASGGSLTVRPGVVVKMWTGASVFVQGTLWMDGKADADSQVVFTSLKDDNYGTPNDTNNDGSGSSPARNDWGSIEYQAGSTGSVSYAILKFGYAGSGVYGMLRCVNSSPPISNCEISSAGYGIEQKGLAASAVTGNVIGNCLYTPIVLSVSANPTFSNNTFSNNGRTALGIIPETIGVNSTLRVRSVAGFDNITYWLPNDLTVAVGANLRVEPGVVVKMQLISYHPYIYVNGSLTARGSVDSLIVFTAEKDDSHGNPPDTQGDGYTAPGNTDWRSIQFSATSIDSLSTLDSCVFAYGGLEGAVWCSSSSPSITDCEFRGNYVGVGTDGTAAPMIRDCEFDSNYYAAIRTQASSSPVIQDCEFLSNYNGLRIENSSRPTVDSCQFRLTTYLPISQSAFANPTYSGLVFENNYYDALGLIGETIGQHVTLRKWDVAGYTNITRVLTGTLTVGVGAKLTIEPGIVIKMSRYSFGYNVAIDGAIRAAGTESEPIVFTSIADDGYGSPKDTQHDGSLTQPAGRDWDSIGFQDVSADTSNVFQWCVFRYGGYNQVGGVRILTASPTFSNCTFESNSAYGIRIDGASNPTIESCTFGKHTSTPIVMSLSSDPTFTGNNNFLKTNAYSGLGIIGETLSQDVLWKRRNVAGVENIPYVLTGTLSTGLSAILRIQPGVVIKGGNITVKRGLIAEGKADPESLIVFTSPRDDFYGGDTNNDSTATDGSSSRWGYIQIDNEATDDSTRFEYCVFRYGTNSSTSGGLNVTNADPEMSHCVFEKNGIGINYNGAAGDSTRGKIEHCDFSDNTYYGVKNTGMAFVISAKNCWWGDSTGPKDLSDDRSSGGFYNPGGLGDPVTDKVDYSGWKTSGAQNYPIGDVSLNGEIRAFDASLVLQHLAELDTLTSQQQAVGDVDCSGLLSTLDASYILRYVAGLLNYFPCALDSAGVPCVPARALVASNPVLYLPGREPGDFHARVPAFTLESGGKTTVPIEVWGEGELLGHEYHISFDPEQIVIEDVSLTEAAAGAMLYWNVVKGNELRVVLASTELLPVEGAVEITLAAQRALETDESIPFDLALVRFNEQDITDHAESEGGVAIGGVEIPDRFALRQNHPNPFNPSTTIRYEVPRVPEGSVHVRMTVYNVTGKLVRALVDKSEGPGFHDVTWDGRDDRGQPVGSGVYFYRIQAGNFTATHKMVVVR